MCVCVRYRRMKCAVVVMATLMITASILLVTDYPAGKLVTNYPA